MTVRLKELAIQHPYKGLITTLPVSAVPPQAFTDMHNFANDAQNMPSLIKGHTLLISTPVTNSESKWISDINQLVSNEGQAYLIATTSSYGAGDGDIYCYDKTSPWNALVSGGLTAGYDHPVTSAQWSYPWNTPANHSNYMLLIANGVDAVQKVYYDTNTKTVKNDALGGLSGAGIDSAKIVRVFADYVILLSTVENGVAYPYRVRWSSLGAPETWENSLAVPVVTDVLLSDLTDDPWEIVTGENLNYNFVIYKERSIYFMQYVGTPTVMRIQKVSSNIGCIGTKAVCNIGEAHAFVGNDNVYLLDGSGALTPIGDNIKTDFFAGLSPSSHNSIILKYNRTQKELTLAFPPSATAETLTLQSQDTTKWDITIDDNGILTNTSGSSNDATTVALQAEDGSVWGLTIGDDGKLICTGGSVGTPTSVFLSSPSDIVYEVNVNHLGVLYSAPPTLPGKKYVYHFDTQTWSGVHDFDCNCIADYAPIQGSSNVMSEIMGKSDGKIYTTNTGYTFNGTVYDGRVVTGLSDLKLPNNIKMLQRVHVFVDSADANSVKVSIGHTDNTNDAVVWYVPATQVANGKDLYFDCNLSYRYFCLKLETVNGGNFRLLGYKYCFIPRETWR